MGAVPRVPLRVRSMLRELGWCCSKKRIIGLREESRVRKHDFENFQVEERIEVIKETHEHFESDSSLNFSLVRILHRSEPSVELVLFCNFILIIVALLQARALISRLTEEKNNAIQQNSKLHQELELLKREGNKSRGGVSFVIVVLIGLLGIIMGYLMKKT
ncbi:Phosphoglycerate mutase-like protein AT74H [Glycine soja]|uniref:Phosphoglycerate mutase-like protein AT74H n=1 Tax=Glycine soja TaxID=3848 RepID=A0A445KJN9_GLYSO|nr:Phosphoglycerate mutase-like protein AT74H [Glycine soja]